MNSYNKTENSSEVKNYLMNWLSVSADNIVILILLLALAVKFIFFEDKGDIAKQLQSKVEDDTEEKVENECVRGKENESEDVNMLSIKLPFKQNFSRMQSISFPSKIHNWSDDKEDQIDEKQCNIDKRDDKNLPPESKVPRSLKECLEIYKSDVSKGIISICNPIYFSKYR